MLKYTDNASTHVIQDHWCQATTEVMGFHALGVTWLDSKDYSWVIIPLNMEGCVHSEVYSTGKLRKEINEALLCHSLKFISAWPWESYSSSETAVCQSKAARDTPQASPSHTFM